MTTEEQAPESMSNETVAALRSLSERYARGADRNDAALFAGVFHPDGRLQVHNPTGVESPAERSGDELSAIPGKLRRYDATFHMLGQSTYTVDSQHDVASGEVYCLAHHLTRTADGATDFVMFIRYNDDYVRDADGAWLIGLRRVLVDWTETRPAN